MLNYQINLDPNYINYLIIGNKHMSLVNKVKEALSNPISINYKEKKEYNKLEMVVLNPAFLFLLVSWVTWSAWDVSRPQVSSLADTELSNAMVYFENGDFDNAVLQLELVVENHQNTSAANHASFYLGRTAFINGNKDKALMLLSQSASRLQYPALQTEAYLMLGQLDSDTNKALKFFDKASKTALSVNEKTYISILKAKRIAVDGNIEQSLIILKEIQADETPYKELYEEVYGMVLTLN